MLPALLAGRALSLHNSRYFYEKKENKCEFVQLSSKRVHNALLFRKFCLIGARDRAITGSLFLLQIDRSIASKNRTVENFLLFFFFLLSPGRSFALFEPLMKRWEEFLPVRFIRYSVYVTTRFPNWLDVTIFHRDDFAIIGFLKFIGKLFTFRVNWKKYIYIQENSLIFC